VHRTASKSYYEVQDTLLQLFLTKLIIYRTHIDELKLPPNLQHLLNKQASSMIIDEHWQ
jgi:hypothetical protein